MNLTPLGLRIDAIVKNKNFRAFIESEMGLINKVEINYMTKQVTIFPVSTEARVWSWSDFLEFEEFIKGE